MLDTEYKYFIKNKAALISAHLGKYLVIVGNDVVGVYASDKEAYFEALKTYKPATFLIQFCTKDEGAYHQSFHSRVEFKNE